MIDTVNPQIITWARERCGFTLEELAAKVKQKPEVVQGWEDGTCYPAYTMLEALAYRHLRIPLAVFFFPEPPLVDDPSAKFRHLPDYELERLSPDTVDKMRQAQCYQDSLVELLGTPPQELLHRRFSATPQSLPRLAPSVRRALGISLRDQFAFRQPDIAFKAWRHAVEEAGIFTFKDSFKDRFICGFGLLHEDFPVIMVNNSNSFTRQVFTLVHEIGHILIQRNGITDADESYFEYLSQQEKQAEIACNRFAADLLVPREAFVTEFVGLSPKDPEAISNIASRFCVSREVILRRLLDEGLIDIAFYSRMTSQWNRDYLRRKQKTTGGDYYLTRLSYVGEGFARLALEQNLRGQLSIAEAAGHLNVKARNIPKLQAYLGW